MMRLLLPMFVVLCGLPLFGADLRRKMHRDGFSGTIGVDFDGSRFRTSAFDFGLTAEWGSQDRWVGLALDSYTDLQSDWRLRTDSYATLELGQALLRDHDERLYVNAVLQLDAHSQLSSQGGDISPEINVAKGLTEDWWVGGALSAVLSTDPDEGYRRGYASLTLWVTYLSAWLPNESDSIGLSIWAATNEDAEADKALFITLEYEFDLADNWEANVGIGTDPLSPWDHLGVYGQLGILYRF